MGTYFPQFLRHILKFLQDAFQLPDHHFHAPPDALPLADVAVGGCVFGGLLILQAPGVHPSQGARAAGLSRLEHSAFAQPDVASTEPLSAGEISTS